MTSAAEKWVDKTGPCKCTPCQPLGGQNHPAEEINHGRWSPVWVSSKWYVSSVSTSTTDPQTWMVLSRRTDPEPAWTRLTLWPEVCGQKGKREKRLGSFHTMPRWPQTLKECCVGFLFLLKQTTTDFSSLKQHVRYLAVLQVRSLAGLKWRVGWTLFLLQALVFLLCCGL